MLMAIVQYIEVCISHNPVVSPDGYPRDIRHQHSPLATRVRTVAHDLAYEAKVSRSYLSQIEKGTFYASLKIVGRVASALDVEPAELLKLPPKRSRSSQ